MTKPYYRSFIKDNSTIIIGNMLVSLKGIILMPIIIKTVGVTVYGGFVLFMSLLGIVFGISSFGAGFRAQRYLPSTGDMPARRKFFYRQFFFQMLSILFLSLLLMLLNRQINIYIFKNEISYSILIIPLYLFCHFLYSQGYFYFRYTSRISYMTVAGISYPYIFIGLILLFFYFYRYMNLNTLVMCQIFASFLIAIPCFWIIFSELGPRFSFYNIKDLISDIKIGFPIVLGVIVDFILAGSDRYFIAFYLTVAAVGHYNPGYVLGSLIIFVPKAMGGAIPQLISKAVDNDNEYDAQRMLNYALKIFLLLAIPFIFGSMILSKPILTLLANIEVAEKAYLITPIVALGTLFYGLNITLSQALFVRLKTYEMFKMNLLASAFNLLANLIALYFFKNIIVAAITTFLSYFIAFIYVYKIVIKDWPVDFQPILIVKSLTASLFMATLLFWISLKSRGGISVSMLAVEMVLGIVVYIASLLILGTFSKKELRFVKNFVCRWAIER